MPCRAAGCCASRRIATRGMRSSNLLYSDLVCPRLLPAAAQVLEDLRACLQHVRLGVVGNGIENIMSSRSMFVAEVENTASWTIKALGRGAAELLQVPQATPPISKP